MSAMRRKNDEGIVSSVNDRTFSGKLEDIKKDIIIDEFGKKRICHTFVIKSVFSIKSYIYKGPVSINLLDYFEIGEKVIHHAGYAVPTKKNRSPGTPRICIECCEIIPSGNSSCPFYGKGIAR